MNNDRLLKRAYKLSNNFAHSKVSEATNDMQRALQVLGGVHWDQPIAKKFLGGVLAKAYALGYVDGVEGKLPNDEAN